MRVFALIGILLFFNCKTAKPSFDIEGHRGCRGLYPENSLPAFEHAITLGVTTLELDLAISKDKKVVVSHEPFMNHEIALDPYGNNISAENEKNYNLYTMSYDSIKQYDSGSKQHPRFPNQKKLETYKPLLSEVIDLAEKKSRKKIQYNIEIKSSPEYDEVFSPNVDEFVRLALQVLNTKKISKRVILQSFDVRALEEIHKYAPKIRTALLVDEGESIERKLADLSFKPTIASPDFKLLDKTVVEKLQRQGLKVIPWTLNKKEDITRMLDYGVDGIISDYPNIAMEVLDRQSY